MGNQPWLLLKVAAYCMYQSLRHPRTEIIEAVNPIPIKQSPIPWWGSISILIIGIASWCLSTTFNITGLDEAARAMVYIPLGNIFGMSLSTTQRSG